MERDHYTLPEQKAVWGFSGSAKEVKVGKQDKSATGSYSEKSDPDAGRKNGGGAGSKAKASE